MSAITPQSLLTFRGEFPDSVLVPSVRIAQRLARFENVHGGSLAPEEEMAFFEILDAEGCFMEPFASDFTAAAQAIHRFSSQLLGTAGDERRILRDAARFARALERIAGNLKKESFLLSHRCFREIVETAEIIRASERIHAIGMHEYKGFLLELKQEAPIGEQRLREFLWFEFAETISDPENYGNGTLDGITEAREIIRTIELDLPPEDIMIPFRYDIGKSLGRPDVIFYFGRPTHPLSVANIFGLTEDQRVVFVGSLSRVRGDITWIHYPFTPFEIVCPNKKQKKNYVALRDLIILSLFEMLGNGDIQEQEYISKADETNEQPVPENTIEIPDNAEGDHEDVQDTPREKSIEAVPALHEAKIGKVPSGKLGWRNIVSTLHRHGVEFSKNGKHFRLKKGEKSTIFMNMHEKTDPRFRKIKLYEALDALGIPRIDFFRELVR